MASHAPIPPADDGFWRWARTPAFDDAIVTLNKLCALEVISGGNRFPVRFAGENAVIEISVGLGGGALPSIAAYSVLANSTSTSALPVSTVSPILTSVIFGPSGGAISGTAGTITLTASGSNKDVFITPSGNGHIIQSQNINSNIGLKISNTTNSNLALAELIFTNNAGSAFLGLGASLNATTYVANYLYMFAPSTALGLAFWANSQTKMAVDSDGVKILDRLRSEGRIQVVGATVPTTRGGLEIAYDTSNDWGSIESYAVGSTTPRLLKFSGAGFEVRTGATLGAQTKTALFSSSGDLALGNASSIAGSVTFNNATNANTLTVKSGVVSSSYTLTFPTAVGGAGSVLTDSAGTGVLSWSAGAASVIPLFDHYVDGGNVTTGETDLYSDTTAAGRLANNGEKLELEYGGVFVSSATATRQVRLYFAGTAIFDTGTLTLSLSSAWTLFATLIRVSSTVVRYMISFTTEGAALSAYTATGELTGLTLSGTNIAKITGQAAGVGAATNDIVAKLGAIQFVAAA